MLGKRGWYEGHCGARSEEGGEKSNVGAMHGFEIGISACACEGVWCCTSARAVDDEVANKTRHAYVAHLIGEKANTIADHFFSRRAPLPQ